MGSGPTECVMSGKDQGEGSLFRSCFSEILRHFGGNYGIVPGEPYPETIPHPKSRNPKSFSLGGALRQQPPVSMTSCSTRSKRCRDFMDFLIPLLPSQGSP